MSPLTYWNGEPAYCVEVRVRVGNCPRDWWCARYIGRIRKAVRVRYGPKVFYLDNEDGSGWLKVTAGRGLPQYPHRSVPVATEEDIERCVEAAPS